MPGGEVSEEGRGGALPSADFRAQKFDQKPRFPSPALLIALGAVCAIWLVALSRWIVTDTVVPWDSKNQFYAFFRFLAQTLHEGAWPFWNPYHYGGHPSIADPQSLIFAPAFVLWALFDATPSLRAFDVLVYAHLLVGGLSVALIGWRAGWPAAACVLAAALFMFGGAASGRLQHTGLILSYALFPPALLLLQLALARRSILIAVAFSVVAVALVLGRNQVALLLCFVLIAAALAEIATAPYPLDYFRKRLPVLSVMLFVGAALLVVPMLLTLQFASLSNRPDVVLDAALKGSLHPSNLATLGIANVFGSHDVAYWGPSWRMPEIEFTDQSFNYMFVGAVPVVLLLWFGFASGGVFRRGRLLATAVLAFALLYMLGRYTPFFTYAFAWMPGVHLFRRPVDGNFVLLNAIAFLSGHLLTDYMREGLPRAALRRGLAALTLALTGVASAVWLSTRFDHGGDALLAALWAAPVFLIVIGALALPRSQRARAYTAAGLTAFAIAELLWWNAASHLNAETSAAYAVLEKPSAEDGKALDILDRDIRERHRKGEYPRVEIMGVGGPWQNLAMVRGWEATNGYNPLRIGIYDRLVSPGEATFAPALRVFPLSFESYDCALAKALGLEYVVLNRPIEQVVRLTRLPAADILLDGPKLWIYRLRNPMPRLNFTTRIQVADADARNIGGELLFNPSADRVLIDDNTPLSRRYAAGLLSGDVRSAKIASLVPGRIEINTESNQGGVLAWHGTYYPGWIAEIDGSIVPILRADVLFRGIEVPAGKHRVVFRFAPFRLENLANALQTALGRRD